VECFLLYEALFWWQTHNVVHKLVVIDFYRDMRRQIAAARNPRQEKKMKIVAIMGSYRKGKTIDTLMDKAIEGVKEGCNAAEVEKIYLADRDIKYCKNCMVCRKDDPAKAIAKCPIDDDMQQIYPLLDDADAYIFGTPVNMGAVTAVMKTFLERICWTLARPGRWPIKGCPVPRSKEAKKAIALVSSGIIAPLFRRWCDDATPLIKSVCQCSLNARLVGKLYAGAVEKRGVDYYLDRAYKLGKKLAS
jgi:NAD(P)H-dependent FMN reductase